jgi:cyclopropane fatty-acyl-phospholipid synthase-like methyltransferase
VLDVGAGNRQFVKIAANEYDLEATGLEIFQASADFARDVIGVDLSVDRPRRRSVRNRDEADLTHRSERRLSRQARTAPCPG